jgi:hypothetical protein
MIGVIVIIFGWGIMSMVIAPFNDLATASPFYSGSFKTSHDFLSGTVWTVWPRVAGIALAIWLFAVSIRRRRENVFVNG